MLKNNSVLKDFWDTVKYEYIYVPVGLEPVYGLLKVYCNHMENHFSDVLTLEQFKALKKTTKLNIKKLVEKGMPVFYVDADGGVTHVQKRVICDDFGEIIGICSQEIANEIECNQSITAKPLMFGVYEYIGPGGIVEKGYTLYHPSESIDVVRYCVSCGCCLPAESKFCPECGKPCGESASVINPPAFKPQESVPTNTETRKISNSDKIKLLGCLLFVILTLPFTVPYSIEEEYPYYLLSIGIPVVYLIVDAIIKLSVLSKKKTPVAGSDNYIDTPFVEYLKSCDGVQVQKVADKHTGEIRSRCVFSKHVPAEFDAMLGSLDAESLSCKKDRLYVREYADGRLIIGQK